MSVSWEVAEQFQGNWLRESFLSCLGASALGRSGIQSIYPSSSFMESKTPVVGTRQSICFCIFGTRERWSHIESVGDRLRERVPLACAGSCFLSGEMLFETCSSSRYLFYNQLQWLFPITGRLACLFPFYSLTWRAATGLAHSASSYASSIACLLPIQHSSSQLVQIYDESEERGMWVR